MQKPSLLDLGFLLTETADSPKHVGGLLLFKKPPKSRTAFVADLVAELRTFDQPTGAFNRVIDFSALGGARWLQCEDFRIEDHVFYHRPKSTLNRKKLNETICDLHDSVLDRSRPLWEFHVIDRVEGGRFAVYAKLHHAYADGITMSLWLANSLSDRAQNSHLNALWMQQTEEDGEEKGVLPAVGRLFNRARGELKIASGLAKLTAQLGLEQINLTRNAVALPFRGPRNTPLTGQVTAGRQLATAQVSMDRVQRLKEMTRSTLNHVALTCVDGALHRYLQEIGFELDRPITIQMPVSLRLAGANDTGNKIGIVLVDLANPTNDPYQRLREIGFTLRNVRNQIDGVAPDAVQRYTMMMMGFSQVAELFRLNDALPPLGNTLVSNLPGPKKPLYMGGALLEEMMPVSTLPAGNHLNITLFSYAGNLQFGLIASKQLQHLDMLSAYIEQSFVDLEEAVLNPPANG